MNDLIIIGSGGFGCETAWLAENSTEEWQIKGFLDDTAAQKVARYRRYPILGPISDWIKYPDAYFVIAVGSPRVRHMIYQNMIAQGQPKFASLIHNTVQLSAEVDIAPGCIITAGNIITTNVLIKAHSIINLQCTIGHNAIIGEFSTLAPQVALSGDVTLGAGVEIGTNASIRQGLSIETGAMVAMGATVVKAVGANQLVVGTPAKSLKALAEFKQAELA